MRKKLLAVSLLVILLSLAAYGTYAYLTEEARTTNVITTGTIDISLHETTTDADGKQVAFPKNGISGVVPGKAVDKLVTVENVGTGDSWVRVGVACKIVAADKMTELPLALANKENALLFDINTEAWSLGEDGYYYYNTSVAPEGVTEQLFSKVTFNPAMGNEYQECTVYVDVEAQAVQVKNNPGADGWPAPENADFEPQALATPENPVVPEPTPEEPAPEPAPEPVDPPVEEEIIPEPDPAE